jgi:hypothetical protein
LGNKIIIYSLRIVYSIVITVLILILLIVLKHFNVLDVFHYIQKLRGTEHYEGETKTVELVFIASKIIAPTIFLTSMLYFVIKVQKEKINK